VSLPSSTVGRKIVMAITGQVLVLFIVFHIAGNSTIFFHKLNAYVAGLYELPVFVWGGRIVLLLAFIFHSYYGIVLKLENHEAKPQSYAVTSYRKATFAGRNQIWTGVLVLVFLVYHLLQFTFQVTNPGIGANTHSDMLGRPDVLGMVVLSFQQVGIVTLYVISLVALGLHLLHGMQSSIQTWGLNNDRTLPIFEKTGLAISIVLFVWYAAIPISILMRIVK
jgi:succinate dehydrogenase / fumarate reductase cytochrome b subunit